MVYHKTLVGEFASATRRIPFVSNRLLVDPDHEGRVMNRGIGLHSLDVLFQEYITGDERVNSIREVSEDSGVSRFASCGTWEDSSAIKRPLRDEDQ